MSSGGVAGRSPACNNLPIVLTVACMHRSCMFQCRLPVCCIDFLVGRRRLTGITLPRRREDHVNPGVRDQFQSGVMAVIVNGTHSTQDLNFMSSRRKDQVLPS